MQAAYLYAARAKFGGPAVPADGGGEPLPPQPTSPAPNGNSIRHIIRRIAALYAIAGDMPVTDPVTCL
jgi:hypothetical protein